MERTAYDNELIEILKGEIDAGEIRIRENVDDYITEIEGVFAMGFNRINWPRSGYVLHSLIEKQGDIRREEIKNFLGAVSVQSPELLSEATVAFGDGVTNLAFEMTFSKFISCSTHFFDLPQHIYVWFPESKKCLNLTFEDELFFG